jgi:hypothetical protein
MCSNYNNTNEEDKGSDLKLSLSDRAKEKGIIEDITINTKTKSVKVALNHGCKQTIISPIYRLTSYGIIKKNSIMSGNITCYL